MNQLTEKEQMIAGVLRERLAPNSATLKQHEEMIANVGNPETEQGQKFVQMDENQKLQMVAGLNHTKGYCAGMKEGISLVLRLMDMDEQELQDWIEEEAAMKAEEEKRMQDLIKRGTGGRGLKR